MTGRTANRDQDWTVSAEVTGRLFDRLAGPTGLTENRRQLQAWEREALELVRSGLINNAVAAYQPHDRVVAADSKPAATRALLQD